MTHRTDATGARVLACDMREDCAAPVTHIDEKGYAYCASHGAQRRASCRCRKLRPAELARLRRGETLGKY